MNAWQAVLEAFALAAARIVPVVWQFPPLGGRRAPAPIRLLLGGMVAALFVPVVLSGLGAPAAGPDATLVLVLARELLVGLSIGFCAAIIFRAAELAGDLSSASLGLPPPGAGIGDLYELLSIVAFLELGGLGLLAEALMQSYRAIPVLLVAPSGEWRGIAELVVVATARLWESAFTLAAPVLVATWGATLALAAIGRVVPELGGGALWLPVRPWLGLAILLLGVGVFEGATFGASLGGLWPLVNQAIDVWHRP